MKKKIFCAAVAAAALAACVKTEVEDKQGTEEMVSLEIVMPASATKIAGAGGDDEMTVSDYQVFIYDAESRMLEAYATPSPTSETVSMTCTSGSKNVVVLANAPDMSSVVSYDRLVQTRSQLSDNSPGKLVMEGDVSVELTALNNKVTVELKRIVSKVVLKKIETDFELPAYDDMDFILKSAYLINVAGDRAYLAPSTPLTWYNKLENKDEHKSLLWGLLGDTNLRGVNVYETMHHFYCYPNFFTTDANSTEWSPRPTRLVVEAELGGKTYYYPVKMEDGLRQNTEYYVSMKIIRPGSTSPEQDMEKSAAVFTIDVKGWDGPVNVTETI